MWPDIILPCSWLLVVFCIMVMAGELKEAERKVLSVIMTMENQKFLVIRQQRAVSGKAMKLLYMHIFDLIVKFSLVSRRSLRMPLARLDINPPHAKENAFMIEY